MTTYRTKFWNDYLWILSINLIVGLAMYLVGIALLIEGVVSFLGLNPTLNVASGYFGLFVGLFLVCIGQVCMWIFWAHLKGTVSFTDKEIIYRYPRLSLFFLYKEKIALYDDINCLFLGKFMMEQVYPDDSKLIPRQLDVDCRRTGIKVRLEKEGEIKLFDLPIIHNQEYYDEFKNLINRLGFQQTAAKYIFIRNKSPHP